MNKKISIITPCYNGEEHLKPHIESILAQTYKNMEYIFVNDGSTDSTEDIILSYQDRFKAKDIHFIYLKQKNKGQASAINLGLKYMQGEYFSGIDSDDILLPEFVAEMSAFLESHPECSICFPIADVVKEKTYEHLRYRERKLLPKMVDTFIDDMIKDYNMPVYPSYMIRMSDFVKIYPDKNIYEGKSSQNIQLILPFVYRRQVGYLQKCLIKYVERKHSASHGLSKERKLVKISHWEDLYCNTLKIIPNMPDYEKGYYFTKIKERWANEREMLGGSKKFKSVQGKYTFSYKLKAILSNEKQSKLVLWGASLFLEDFLKRFNIKNDNIIGIIDKNPKNKNCKLGNYTIYAPEDIKNLKPDEIIMTIVNNAKQCYVEIDEFLTDNNLGSIFLFNIDDKYELMEQ